jgi:hypothetical protein
LRIYAHTSLLLLSYCGVHAVCPLCIAHIPYRDETCHNSKIKCDFDDILGNLNVIVMTFKIKVYVVLETETSG